VAIASAIMGAVVHIIGQPPRLGPMITLIVAICAGAIVYFAALVTLGEFSSEELKTVWATLRKALASVQGLAGVINDRS